MKEIFKLIFSEHTINHPDKSLLVGFFELLTGYETAKGDRDSVVYDVLGRDSLLIRTNGVTSYTYYQSGNGKGKVYIIAGPTGYKKFSYDIYGNVTRECDSISSTEKMVTAYTYDTRGRLATMTYPNGFAIGYYYNSYGYLYSIRNMANSQNIWYLVSADAGGRILQSKYPYSYVTHTNTYDPYGRPTEIKAVRLSTNLQWFGYSYDANTGDMTQRKDKKRNLTETFGYDQFDRPIWAKPASQDSLFKQDVYVL